MSQSQKPETILLTAILNPFDPHGSRQIEYVPWQEGEPVTGYVTACFPAVRDGYDYECGLNGGLITKELLLLTYPQAGDSITFCLVPQGGGDGGGKSPLRMIAMLAVVAGAVALGQVYGAAFAGNFMWATGVQMSAAAGAMILTSAGMMVGGYLVNALLPPPKSDIPESSYGSPTYGWNAIGNMALEGGPCPALYGTMRVYPYLISKYTSMIGDKQTLNLLYMVADHALDSIGSTEINDVDASDFTDVSLETRLGALDQTVIPGFENLITEQTIHLKLEKDINFYYQAATENLTEDVWSATYTTVKTDCQAVRVKLLFPNGLWIGSSEVVMGTTIYYIGGTGEATFNIDYRVVGAPGWTTKTYTVYGNWLSAAIEEGVLILLPAPGQYQVRVMMTDITAFADCTAQFYGLHEMPDQPAVTSDLFDDDIYSAVDVHLYFPYGLYDVSGTTLEEMEVQIAVDLAAEVLGAPDWDNARSQVVTVKSASNATIWRTVKFTELTPGTAYAVRAYFAMPPLYDAENPSVYQNECWLEYVSLYQATAYTYPGTSLLAVRAIATDKLSGSLPRVSCIATRSTVPVYDEDLVAWDNKDAENRAWQAYDMHVNDEYGGGVPYARMIYSDFKTWGDWCDDHLTGYLHHRDATEAHLYDFHGGIYYDSTRNFPDAKALIERLGWGCVVQRGTSFGVVIDKPGAIAQAFGVGNIMPNSFSQSFIRQENRVNSVEVTCYPSDDDYDRKTIEIKRQDWTEASTKDMEKGQVDLIGCTSRSDGVYQGQYMMACNQLLKRIVSIRVGVDAIACEVGDLIAISHDLPQWGYSGRVVSATVNTVTLNRSVTIVGGSTYQIMVRHQATDTLETKTVTSGAGTYTTLSISGTWATTPTVDAVFMFGVTSALYEDFRVIAISLTQDEHRTITALEYDSDIYTPNETLSDDQTVSDLDLVTDLVAKEFFRWQDPSVRGFVELTWRGQALSWFVWYGKQKAEGEAVNEWIYAGQVFAPRINLYDLDARGYYSFNVSARNNQGSGETITDSYYTGYGTRIFQVPKVHGLKVKGDDSGLNYYTGIDLTCEWSNMMYFEYPAGEEPVGAGSQPVSYGTFVGYYVQVYGYNASTPLAPVYLRSATLGPMTEATYTYAANVYDTANLDTPTTPYPNLMIEMWGLSEDGKWSWGASRIICWNQPPDDITGLTAYSKIGGARFAWDANEQPDFMYYQCQVYVGASAPDWNTVEILQTTGTSFTRNLTGAEILAYGFRATVYFRVVATDMFSQVSVNAVETSVTANQPFDNHMEVGATIGTGISGSVMSLIDGDLDSAGVTVA